MCSAVFNGLAGEEDWCVFCLVARVHQFWHWYFSNSLLSSFHTHLNNLCNSVWRRRNMLSPSEIGTLVERCITVFKWLSAATFCHSQVSKVSNLLMSKLWDSTAGQGWPPSCNVVTMISTFLLCIQSQPEPAEIDHVSTILHHQHYVTWINAYLDTNWWYLSKPTQAV